MACKPAPDAPDFDPGAGLLGDHALNPFPTAAMIGPDGHLALNSADFDLGTSVTPLPVERLAWRTGFSPVQTGVVVLEGVDPSGFAGSHDAEPGAGTVWLVDLTAGELWPTFAELDAWPEADPKALMIRPLRPVPVGHEVAAVVSVDAAPRPERFSLLLSAEPPAVLAAQSAETKALVARLGEIGIAEAEIAVAWSWPVSDGTAPLRSVWAQAEPATGWSWTRKRELEAGDTVAPHTWRVWQGRFSTTDWLVDDKLLSQDATGAASPTGVVEAELYVHVPTSVKDAPAGTVPVMVFGHGIFSQPSLYLDKADDPSGLNQLAEDMGVIVVATAWRGLTTTDAADALLVADDFGKFPEITDRLVQGQANVRALAELAASPDFLADPVFLGAQGQALVDPGEVVYYGISLGAIEGSVFWAGDPPVKAAAFHVGGAMWSTMLERSSNWSTFEVVISNRVTDPVSRQRAYALTQLWWDVVDPASYVTELSERPFLYQISLGDEQVPNFTSEAFARGVGLPLLGPSVEPVVGLDEVPAPLAAPAQALVQFDPELGRPPEENRPAVVTRAHDGPRVWPTAQAQISAHLLAETRGVITEPCAGEPCTAENAWP